MPREDGEWEIALDAVRILLRDSGAPDFMAVGPDMATVLFAEKGVWDSDTTPRVVVYEAREGRLHSTWIFNEYEVKYAFFLGNKLFLLDEIHRKFLVYDIGLERRWALGCRVMSIRGWHLLDTTTEARNGLLPLAMPACVQQQIQTITRR
jgi:hypothetical protein